MVLNDIKNFLVQELNKVFDNNNLEGNNGLCQFVKSEKQNILCLRKAEHKHQGKYYCGKLKPNNEYSMHMGTVTKYKSKKTKLTKAEVRKIADDNTQNLINKITNAFTIQARRAWDEGPFIYTSDVYGAPKLVLNEKSGKVDGVLVDKEIRPLTSTAIKMCRAMKLPYVYEDEEDEEIIEENSSELEDSGSDEEEQNDQDELQTSEEEESADDFEDNGADWNDSCDDD